MKERIIHTWSPSEGTSPEPTRSSKALTPPELGSSEKSAIGRFEEGKGKGEEDEDGGGSEKIKAEKVVETRDRDKGLLVILHEYFV